jgi:hypothetical protein
MSCGVANSCKRMLGKLLTKLQQADLLAGHNFKKGQIMHIVNNILKGIALGMDGNHARNGQQPR